VRNSSHGSADESKRCSSEFVIRHEKLELRIFLSAAKSLLLHEETIPDRVSELKGSILRDGVVKDPLVIDADSCVVLDGMHRVATLRDLNCSCVPVCAVDYANPSIKVGTWFRTVSGQVTPTQFKAGIASFSITMERLSADITSMAEDPSLAIIFQKGESFRLASSDLAFAEILRVTEQCARELHLRVGFETEHDAIQRLLNGTADAIMTLPRISKAAIREAGLTGHLLPHKVTRHIIPARPLGVNIALNTLVDESLDLKKANQEFVESLRERRIIRRPSGAVIEGRRYEEETFIFD
jgi:hypothetical protein